MPEWIGWVLALVPILTIMGGGLGALLTFKVQGRTAGAAVLSAEAAHETAAVAGRNAAIQEMAELRQYWTALVANVNADNATIRAENARLEANLAALHASHQQDMLAVHTRLADTKIELEECHALNRAVIERIEEVKHTTSERLETLERGQNGA